MLEANLPITDQAAKRAVCSALLKECAAAAGAGAGAPPPAVSLQPDLVKLHQEAMVGPRVQGAGGVGVWVTV